MSSGVVLAHRGNPHSNIVQQPNSSCLQYPALTPLLLLVCFVQLQRKLMERNVAEEIAGKVVDSVAQSLEGQKLSSFTGRAVLGKQAHARYS